MLQNTSTLLSHRILVVDDAQVNCAVTSGVLESAGYSVECAYDGMQALAKLERETFDLVLLDIEMPGLTGYETASAMQCAEHGAIRLAALTADSSAARRQESREAGLQAHLAKPITSMALLDEVAKLCGTELEARFDPWRRDDYKDLVNRLGFDRVYMYLSKFHQQLNDFLGLEDTERSDVHRLVHDLVSVGGVMGFETFSRCCIDFMAARGSSDEHATYDLLVEAGRQAEDRLTQYFFYIPAKIAG